MSFTPFQSSDPFSRERFNALFQELFQHLVSVETGSYVGNGNYGSANAQSLTFSFAPKLVLILADSKEQTYFGLYLWGNAYMTSGTQVSDKPNFVTTNANTMSWYFNPDGTSLSYCPKLQLNQSGVIYRYFALG